jgi:dihydropyrimidine dehydrogenase (NAD+) subunit PreA
MADLRCSIAGIKSPNPFWLASAPPTDKKYNVERAFRAGWGGAVWKTLGEDPPIVNTCSRYGAVSYKGSRVAGFNNIELVTDRPLEVNLIEIKELKREWPDRPILVSLMVPCEERNWQAILAKVEDTGADGVELNFGCPHGMSERGMGAAVGQVPDYVEMVTRWAKQNTRMPVFVKLTPNVTSILGPARAARRGGADAVSLINTVSSIMSIDLDRMAPTPTVAGKGSHGGYCGPAVKPIALHKVGEIARDPDCRGMPLSGIGGIETWQDAAEFIALGSATVQVCTGAMHYGFKIVGDMIDGLGNWMDAKGYRGLEDFRGAAVPNFVEWHDLDLNYQTIARIDQDLCIKCGLCFIACEDTSHQAVRQIRSNGARRYEVIDEACIGCNLCMHVCPVEGCITMVEIDNGKPPLTWDRHPNNPMRQVATE